MCTMPRLFLLHPPSPHTTTGTKRHLRIQMWWHASLRQQECKPEDGSWYVEIWNSSALRSIRAHSQGSIREQAELTVATGNHCFFSVSLLFPKFASDIFTIIQYICAVYNISTTFISSVLCHLSHTQVTQVKQIAHCALCRGGRRGTWVGASPPPKNTQHFY